MSEKEFRPLHLILTTPKESEKAIQSSDTETKKHAVIEDIKNLFEEGNEEFNYEKKFGAWLWTDNPEPEDIEEMGLNDREKYEAIKKLEAGHPYEILKKLEEYIDEYKDSVDKENKHDKRSLLAHGILKKKNDLLKLKKQISELYFPDKTQKEIETPENVQKHGRESLIRKVRQFFISYPEGLQTGAMYNALTEMQDGHPENALKLLTNAIGQCKRGAAELLDSSREDYRNSDVEESSRMQFDAMDMEDLELAIKKEYSIPIELTPALRRQWIGQKKLTKIDDNPKDKSHLDIIRLPDDDSPKETE